MPFILHTRQQVCSGCGATEQHSWLYVAEALDCAGRAKKLIPATSIGPLDPVHVVRLGVRSTPVCIECVDARTEGAEEIYYAWEQTLKRKLESVQAPTPVNATKPRHVPTLEELA